MAEADELPPRVHADDPQQVPQAEKLLEELGPPDSFETVYERSGVPEEFRLPGFHHFVEGPEKKLYAIPVEITADGDMYDLHSNGAAISKDIKYGWPNTTLVPGPHVQVKPGVIIYGHAFLREGVTVERGASIDKSDIGKKAIIGEKVTVGTSSIGPESVIGARSVITESQVLSNATLGGSTHIMGSKLWENVTIGSGTVLNKTEIGGSSTIGKNCNFHPGVDLVAQIIVGDTVTLGENVHVLWGTKIGDWAQINSNIHLGRNVKVQESALAKRRLISRLLNRTRTIPNGTTIFTNVDKGVRH